MFRICENKNGGRIRILCKKLDASLKRFPLLMKQRKINDICRPPQFNHHHSPSSQGEIGYELTKLITFNSNTATIQNNYKIFI